MARVSYAPFHSPFSTHHCLFIIYDQRAIIDKKGAKGRLSFTITVSPLTLTAFSISVLESSSLPLESLVEARPKTGSSIKDAGPPDGSVSINLNSEYLTSAGFKMFPL